MSNAVLYAMDEQYLQSYIDHKNNISAMLATGKINDATIQKVRAEIDGYRNEKTKQLYTVDADGTAHINIAGPLEPKPDPCAVMFDIDMTTYSDIFNAIEKAETDPMVTNLLFHFSTPGGNVVGLFKTADKIYNCTKPTKGLIHSLCASAGYALGSQCDTLEAENASCEIGSIGVMTEMIDRTAQDKEFGLKRYLLRSENAPDKNPDITNKEGRDKVIKRLTDTETVFLDYVSRGRNVAKETILSDFGKGGILIARDSLKFGMIDAILSDVKPISAVMPTAEIDEINAKKEKKSSLATDTGEKINHKEQTMAGETISMTQEQLNELVANTAKQTASEVQAQFKAQETAAQTENARVATYNPLYAKFPEQKKLIDEELKKGTSSTAEFAILLSETESARLAALNTQKTGATETQNTKTPKGDGTADRSGDEFLASMGFKMEAK